MENELWFTAIVNKVLGPAVRALLTGLSTLPHLAWVMPADPLHPIPNYFAAEVLVFLVIVIGAVILRTRLSVENPGKFQLAMETYLGFTHNLLDEVIGHDGRRYVAMVGTMGLFIFLCNLQGLIPTMMTPTTDIAVPVGCAVIVYVYYNFHGLRAHGIAGYMRHLSGPLSGIGWILVTIAMFGIEVFSGALRMLSLSVRLWANMMAGELSLGVFTSLTHVVVPVLFLTLHLFESFLQAYIFMILPVVYLSLATSEEH